MKIVVTAAQPSLDAAVDPRFGRCPYFVIVETDDLAFEAVENPNVTLGGGAGIQSAQLISEKGAICVLTGNCGPNAYQTLSAAGIEVIVGCSGHVRDAVERFKAGRLEPADEPNVASRFGTGAPAADSQVDPTQQPAPMGAGRRPPTAGRGMGRGGGMGRGAGRGRGGGRGLGLGRGAGNPTWPPAPIPAEYCRPPEDRAQGQEVTLLKRQAEDMQQEIQEIRQRIGQLEREQQTRGESGDAGAGGPTDDQGQR